MTNKEIVERLVGLKADIEMCLKYLENNPFFILNKDAIRTLENIIKETESLKIGCFEVNNNRSQLWSLYKDLIRETDKGAEIVDKSALVEQMMANSAKFLIGLDDKKMCSRGGNKNVENDKAE